MKISLIVAMASNRTIGINNQLPWHLSADLKRFKQLTLGNPILMGRKTHESIGRPLPGRINIIISRNPDYHPNGCEVFNDSAAALEYCQAYPELFVIGGSSLYASILPRADFIYLTAIHQTFAGDTFFPAIPHEQWQAIERVDINDDASVPFSYSFIKLARR
ncbi:MAG: dihydrofolate reductase [Methylococcaceae bacterium]|nr:dihydrofolate reductase [Methylococcaceae bacterium]